jgi:hypothetical protein
MAERSSGKDKGTTIWLTRTEYALLAEGRELFIGFTKAKMSWGAYLCALSIGALATKALEGISIRCPECEHEVEIKLVNPRVELRRKSRTSQPYQKPG